MPYSGPDAKEKLVKYQAANPEKVRAQRCAAQARYRANHPNARREYVAKKRAEDPDFFKRGSRANRNNKLKQSYGITLQEFEAMFANQEGLCGICSCHMCISCHKCKARCHVDHDHATGKVRGLLCARCNVAIGQFDDNSSKIRNAAVWVS